MRNTKKVPRPIVVLIIVLVSFSGCIEIFTEFVPPPEELQKHPKNPNIIVDAKGGVHLLWENGTGTPEHPASFSYTKLDAHGNRVIDVKSFHGYPAQMLADTDCNIYILIHPRMYTNAYTKTTGLRYIKLNSEGSIMIDKLFDNTYNLKAIMDHDDHIHMIFMQNETLFYMKLDTEGNFLLKKQIPNNSDQQYDIVALRNYTHIFSSQSNGGTHVTTLDSEGNIIANRNYTFHMPTVRVDKDNNLHIFWIVTGGWNVVYYTKLTEEGKVIVNNTLLATSSREIKFTPFIDVYLNIYLFLEEHEVYPIFTQCKKFNSSLSLIYTKEIEAQSIRGGYIDPGNNIHIVGVPTYDICIKHTSINSENGTIVSSYVLSEKICDNPYSVPVTIIMENNVTHLTWSTAYYYVWRSGRNQKLYLYYTVYYTKFDKDGNILIKDMVIDTDGKPSWKTGEYTSSIVNPTLLVVGIACIVLVSVIIVAFFLKRRKRKEINKPPPLNEKHPPPPW